MQRAAKNSTKLYLSITEISEPSGPSQQSFYKGIPSGQVLAQPTRPTEFRAFVAAPFTALFGLLLVLLAVLYAKSRPHG